MSQHSFGAQWYDSGGTQGAAKRIRVKFQAGKLLRSSTDSDLEAFSHNPTDSRSIALLSSVSLTNQTRGEMHGHKWDEGAENLTVFRNRPSSAVRNPVPGAHG